MSPPRWYTITQLSQATGLTHRQLRHLLDRGLVPFVQYTPNDKRLLNESTVAGLERLGIPVQRDELGRSGKDGQAVETRGAGDESAA